MTKKSSVNRTLVLGIDSLSPHLLNEFMDDGELPNFSRLREQSTACPTVNPPNLSETIWTNFYTAVGPGHHGRYFHSQIVPGTYKTRIFHTRDLQAVPYWKRLGDAGCEVVVVDVPKCALTEGLNGVHVANWASHDQELDDGFRTSPAEYGRRLQRYGPDPVSRDDFGGNGPADHAAFCASLIRNIERKTRFLVDLIDQRSWQHCLFVYDDAHAVSHYAWHLHDQSHPQHDPELAARVGDPIRSVCRALDNALGRLLARLDPSVRLLTFLSHGIGPAYHATYVVDEVLRRFQGAALGRGRPVNRLRMIWRSIPVRFHDHLLPVQNLLKDLLLEPDRRRREAFVLPASDDSAVLRINLAGREPAGIVAPGAAFEDCCKRISSQLKSLVNADTGNPVVDDVIRVADYCAGPNLDHLPDLIVKWRRTEPIRAVSAAQIGTVAMPTHHSRTGSHIEDGMLLAFHPNGPAGGGLSDPIRVLDIAPTLCALHGVALPGVEGRPSDALLEILG